MDHHNPYAPPSAEPGSSEAELADSQRLASRSVGEFLILGSLICSLLYLGYLTAVGSLGLAGNRPVAIAIVASFVVLGLVSLWLVARRRTSGAIACMVFYGAQIISGEIGFNSLPTVYFRILGDNDSPTNLNIVALVLFIFSAVLWQLYRGAQLPPNTSLERTRDG
jgi:hypothetical protein